MNPQLLMEFCKNVYEDDSAHIKLTAYVKGYETAMNQVHSNIGNLINAIIADENVNSKDEIIDYIRQCTGIMEEESVECENISQD